MQECECFPGFLNSDFGNCTECDAVSATVPTTWNSPYTTPCGSNGRCGSNTSSALAEPLICSCETGYVWMSPGASERPCAHRPLCRDSPNEWMDSRNFSCGDYATQRWCTADSSVGPDWNPLWGDLTAFGADGLNVTDVCCACGGGVPVNGSTEACCVPQCGTLCGVTGYCSAPDQCTCDADWGGPTCSDCPLDACGANAICFKTINVTEVSELALAASVTLNSSSVATNASRGLTCACPTGFSVNGSGCAPICLQGCVNGLCTAPDVCTCSPAPGLALPAWTGTNCTACIDGRHGCDNHARCLNSGSTRESAACVCDTGYFGNGSVCSPVCYEPCVHGDCTEPNVVSFMLWVGEWGE
jgi:hypothetical protein